VEEGKEKEKEMMCETVVSSTAAGLERVFEAAKLIIHAMGVQLA